MPPSIFPKTSNTTKAVDLFQISGKKVPPQLIRSYLHVKAACAHANFRCGALSKAERDLILRSIAAIRADEPSWEKLFPIDPFQAGAGTTLNMNINEAICLVARRKLKSDILHPNDSVNRSQSTNDTYPTVLRIALLAITPALLGALREIQGAFQRKAKEWATLPKAGRTHLQDAVPMHLGDQMGSYSRTFEKLSSQLSRASDTLREIPLGGSAVGNGMNTPPGFRAVALGYLKAETGLATLQQPRNPFEVQSSMLDVLSFAHALASIAIELQRVCSDLRLQASGPHTGIHEIEFPELIPGSSIMPGKTNPTGLEMTHQVAIDALGAHQMTLWSASMGQFELNVMLPAIAPRLLDTLQSLTQALGFLAKKVILPAKACEAHLRQNWHATEQWATLLAPKWGYDEVADWVRESRKAQMPFLAWLEKERNAQWRALISRHVQPESGRKKKR